jgi:LacI family transcriptional regulator
MDALIVDGHAATDEYLQRMRSAGVPIVLLGRTLPDSDIPTVMPDNFGGARLAVSHLIDHKHQRIVFVTGDPDTDDGRLREQGYRTAMKEAGLEIDPALIVRGDFHPIQPLIRWERRCAESAVHRAVWRRRLRAGVMRAAAVGQNCPQDVAIVGFNDPPELHPRPC